MHVQNDISDVSLIAMIPQAGCNLECRLQSYPRMYMGCIPSMVIPLSIVQQYGISVKSLLRKDISGYMYIRSFTICCMDNHRSLLLFIVTICK